MMKVRMSIDQLGNALIPRTLYKLADYQSAKPHYMTYLCYSGWLLY
jgi:hypothetical protein